MPRPILSETAIHPAIQQKIADLHSEVLDKVQAAVARHAVVVLGMARNPFVARARKALDKAGVPHEYLGYGGYLSAWRTRNAIKMWTGWPTFPMVFVRGVLVGGADDLQRLVDSGELQTRLRG
jgi:glutaredoxin-related protein